MQYGRITKLTYGLHKLKQYTDGGRQKKVHKGPVLKFLSLGIRL